MNMTDNDKELAQYIWYYGKANGDNFYTMFHRYHTAKLEQAAGGYGEWILDPEHVSTIPAAYQAGAASQQTKIAELTEELADLRQSSDLRHEADMRAVAMWREKTEKELTLPDHADLCCWLAEEVERLKTETTDLFEERNEYRLISENENLRKQLQSAQLDNKRLRDAFKKISEFDYSGTLWMLNLRSLATAALSTPLDTSAVDELLARVKDAEDEAQQSSRAASKWADKNVTLRDQRTAARSALKEAREALRRYRRKDIHCENAITKINAALGEEQKKEE